MPGAGSRFRSPTQSSPLNWGTTSIVPGAGSHKPRPSTQSASGSLGTLMMGTSTTLTTNSPSSVSGGRDSITVMPRSEDTSIFDALIFFLKKLSNQKEKCHYYIFGRNHRLKTNHRWTPDRTPQYPYPTPKEPQNDPQIALRMTPQWI